MSLPEKMNKEQYLKTMKEKAIEKTAAASSIGPQGGMSSFLNLSDLSLPDNMTELFQWCKYFFMFDPIIHGAINALATFPVTPITLEETDEWVEKRKEASKEEEVIYKKDSVFLTSLKHQLFQKIKIYKLLIEIGIDYFLYGNCFILGEVVTNKITEEKEWAYVRRVSPSAITIDRYPDGTVKYKWTLPKNIEKIIKDKSPADVYDKIPQIFKQAVADKKSIVIDNNRLYHFSKPSDSLFDTPWGMPGISNVLKLLMYRTTLRQAQEAIAREHIVPLRIFFLNPQNGMSPGAIAGSFGTGANIQSPNQVLAEEIAKTANDPNYKIVSSVPVGMITAGGQGRGLLLAPEIDQTQSEILAGLNVPREFIFGGVSFSGSSVSLKILENHFITYRLLQLDFINNFLIKEIAKERNIWKNEEDNNKLVMASLSELKMQDDVQQKQMAINLNAAGKVSDDYLLRAFGIDSTKEIGKIQEEAIQKASLERAMIIEQVKTQALAKKVEAVENLRLNEFIRKLNVYATENGIDTINRESVETVIDAIETKLSTKDLETYELKTQKNEEKQVVIETGKMLDMAANISREALRDSDLAEQILFSAESEINDVLKFYNLLLDIQSTVGEEAKAIETEEEAKNLSEFMETLEQLVVQYEKSVGELSGQMMEEQPVMPGGEPPSDEAAMEGVPEQEPAQPAQAQPQPEGSQDGIDMRPMPTQRPPRRETLG